LRAILPVVASTFGSDVFAIRELFQSTDPALTLVLRQETRRGLGECFARHVDEAIAGISSRGSAPSTTWR
jgi:hypothetical protein